MTSQLGQWIANVLVVEDDRITREMIGIMLRSEGIGCTLVDDERETVEWLRQDQYDMVLMDIQMPYLDGFKVTHQIRSLPDELKHIPILGITASSKYSVTALEAGMNGLLEKPFTMTQFFEAMWNCISLQGIQSEKQWLMERIPLATNG
jgi:CheY-like chemotaxis protein